MAIRKTGLRLFILLSLLSATSAVRADARTHRQAVDELMRQVRVENLALNWRQRLDNQAIELIGDVLQGRKEEELTSPQKAAVENFSQKARASVDSALDWNALRDAVAKVYMSRFSEAEVRELLSFYRSAIGQKWVGQTAQITIDIDQLIQSRVQTAVPEFKRLGRSLRADFEAASAVRPGAASAVPAPAGATPAMPVMPAAEPAVPAPAVNPKTGRP